MPLKSPLFSLHDELGATFTNFAGYEMPLQYTSIKDEHLAVRKNVGIFDVSHMSNIWVTGKDAEKLISLSTVEDASKIIDGKSQYTALLRENGSVIDDTIFMHIGNKFMIIPNAGMSEIVTKWLNDISEEKKFNVNVENVTNDYVILAMQGPRSKDVLQKITKNDLNEIKFFGCRHIEIADNKCIISQTGYTGEFGFELQITPTTKAENIFRKILDAGKEYGIKPIGLGARDTLRLEKCFILASNEFEGGRTPLEANLSWIINWDHDFIGKNALLKQKDNGDYERLTYLKCIGKGIPRHFCEIKNKDEKVGMVTSGSLSPCLKVGIAMGYVKPDYIKEGNILDIIVRGKSIKSMVVKPPFVKKDWAIKN
jgi:aminomethyltransferase